jgi:dTDP-4-amino-4,6-dideoxygalactose transaminase
LLDLAPQHDALRGELLDAVARVFDSHQFILGAEVEAFEREVAAALGVTHAIGVSSGTDALLVSLMALQIGAGDEVVTTPYSFFATAGCIARLGARPVFVDIDPGTFNLDPALIESALSPRTRAILPVHLFGHPAALDAIAPLAARRAIPVVEDACQAVAATECQRMVGGVGALGCFSFFPSKNLSGAGDGGLVTTNDPELADRVRLLRQHGGRQKYSHSVIGGNFRLDAIQAAILRVKLPHLRTWTDARRANADRYGRYAHEAGLAEYGVTLPIEQRHCRHVYHQYVIRAPRRDELRTFLAGRDIATAIYYPIPLHLQECFKYLGYANGDLPRAEAAARETLALPIYPGLSEEQQEYVVESIAAFYRRGSTSHLS